MNKKLIIIILVLAVLALLGYFALKTNRSGTSGLFVEGNALVTADQRPGDRLRISVARVAEDGFVIIHADADGAPGTIIGMSEMLPPGEHKNVEVVLTRLAKEGEILHAMIHKDNGNRDFDPTTDPAVSGKLGGVITSRFEINPDAEPAETL